MKALGKKLNINKKRLIICLLIILGIAAFLFFIYPGYTFFYTYTLQDDKDKYISFVSDNDYEETLRDDPLVIMDKAGRNKELTDTTLDDITAFREDIHGALLTEYKLNSVATAEKDFDKALQILSWLTENTYYNGMQIKNNTDNPCDLLKFSFNKDFSSAINCRHKAIVFADCLVAVGIKAYPVCMVSGERQGSHFTCRAYISETDSWCLFDPSFGCWFSYDGKPLDLYELRKLLMDGKDPTVEGYNFNGTTECLDVYINGFLRHCMSNLSTWQDNSDEGRDTTNYLKRKQFVSGIPG